MRQERPEVWRVVVVVVFVLLAVAVMIAGLLTPVDPRTAMERVCPNPHEDVPMPVWLQVFTLAMVALILGLGMGLSALKQSLRPSKHGGSGPSQGT
jgi:H+/Cl- antiporter ClcA